MIETDKALARLMGNRTLYGEIIKTFLASTPGLIEGLPGQWRQQDPLDAIRAMHTLKGTAGAVGATELAAFAAESERRMKQGLADGEFEPMMQDLAAHFARALSALEAIAADDGAEVEVPASGSGKMDIDALHAALEALEGFLTDGNMRAINALADIRRSFGDVLGPRLEPLANAVGCLDFATALAKSRELREG